MSARRFLVALLLVVLASAILGRGADPAPPPPDAPSQTSGSRLSAAL